VCLFFFRCPPPWGRYAFPPLGKLFMAFSPFFFSAWSFSSYSGLPTSPPGQLSPIRRFYPFLFPFFCKPSFFPAGLTFSWRFTFPGFFFLVGSLFPSLHRLGLILSCCVSYSAFLALFCLVSDFVSVHPFSRCHVGPLPWSVIQLSLLGSFTKLTRFSGRGPVAF